jgi:ribonuclease HII
MPWIIGIDEAGYGPNLGPFVMSAASCRVPEALAEADLWQTLHSAVRRRGEKDDGRLLLEDSKLIYSCGRGLGTLEVGVLTLARTARVEANGAPSSCSCTTLAGFLNAVSPPAIAHLGQECWYTGATNLPVRASATILAGAVHRLARTSNQAQVAWGHVRSVIVCPARFNAVLERWGSKGVVLALALSELLRQCHNPDVGADPVTIQIDKHGGRNSYAAQLQQALPDGMVLTDEEGPNRSSYRIVGLGRPVQLTFAPRADSTHLCVALASMVSKYLRELLMQEFNDFWQTQVPGLKPTAGYPGDAGRFYQAIKPAAARLGVPTDALWRRK